jgi:predicted MFS family arabinose efflux permease
MLPTRRPAEQYSYPALLGTLGELVRHEPVLRRLALCQATMFGAFTAYWTAIAYELSSAHHLGQGAIGVFALVGAGGAAAAPIAGHLADRGHGRLGRGATFVVAAASCALAGLGAGSIVLLAVGGVLLDFAVQSHQVMSQQVIYTLRPQSRARVNTVYMTTIFTGGAASSAIAGALHSAYGWSGVMVFAALAPLVGLVVWATGRTTAPPAKQADPVVTAR